MVTVIRGKDIAEVQAVAPDLMFSQAQALLEAASEMSKQDLRYGVLNHAPLEWLAVIGEEFGEVSQAVTKLYVPPREALSEQQKWSDRYRAELIQLAAVVLQALACEDRHERASG